MATSDKKDAFLEDTGALITATPDSDNSQSMDLKKNSNLQNEISSGASALLHKSSEDPHTDDTTNTDANEPSISMNNNELNLEVEQENQNEDEETDGADSDSDSDEDFPRFEDRIRGRIAKPVSGQKPPPKPK